MHGIRSKAWPRALSLSAQWRAVVILTLMPGLMNGAAPASAQRLWVPLPEQRNAEATDIAGDAGRGETLFKQCAACHAVAEQPDTGIGPELNGVVGRRAASVESYAYSQDLHAAGQEGLLWTHHFLSSFLRNPSEFLAGTKMAFTGLPERKDRNDIIAYLSDLGPENEDVTRDPAVVSPQDEPAAATNDGDASEGEGERLDGPEDSGDGR